MASGFDLGCRREGAAGFGVEVERVGRAFDLSPGFAGGGGVRRDAPHTVGTAEPGFGLRPELLGIYWLIYLISWISPIIYAQYVGTYA